MEVIFINADSYHLLQQMENEKLSEFQEILNRYGQSFKRETMLPIFTPILSYIEENAQICKILFKNSAANDLVFSCFL